jgi:pimeloyl-ACP methyl ester carboxylesterase
MNEVSLRANGARRRHARQSALAPIVGATGCLAMIGLGLAWAAYVRRYVQHNLPLTAALSGELRLFPSQAGQLAYYTAGHTPRSGPRTLTPLVFIHSVNAAASSFEMKPLYEHYAQERKVYALDLPGFGFSERGQRDYSPQLYSAAINEFIESELKGVAVDAVALSLGSEFLAMAATEEPRHFRSLTFISPTGMSKRDMAVRSNDALLRMLLAPAVSRLLYDTLTSRPGLQLFLREQQRGPLDRRLLHYAYITSHRPDAHYAPCYFLAGKLFTPSIFMAYQGLTQPALAIFGNSRYASHDMDDALHARPNWRAVEFRDSGALVHFDNPQGVITQMDRLFAKL